MSILYSVCRLCNAYRERVVRHQPDRASELAELLDGHRDEITSAAAKVLISRGGPHCRAQSAEDPRALSGSAIDALVNTLATAAYSSPDRVGASTIPGHFARGFDIGEEIEALLLLRDSIPPVPWQSVSTVPAMGTRTRLPWTISSDTSSCISAAATPKRCIVSFRTNSSEQHWRLGASGGLRWWEGLRRGGRSDEGWDGPAGDGGAGKAPRNEAARRERG